MLSNGDTDLCDEEDEDVVIAGSELHEALSKMGYSDYEVVSVRTEELSSVTDKHIQKAYIGIYQGLCKNVLRVYQYLVKDTKALRKQLTSISEARYLLDDHAALIKNLLDANLEIEPRPAYGLLSYLKYAAATVAGYYLVVKHSSNSLTWLATFSALTAARYKYINWRTNRDLRKLISEQTELYYTFKRSLRILNQFFRINAGAKQSGMKFNDLAPEKLKLLQPVTEDTMKSLQIISDLYYRTTLNMVDLLPDSYRRNIDLQIAGLNRDSFVNMGEVTYGSLKQLFYRFILVQSEMLLTLAHVGHSDLSGVCDELKRAMKMEKIVSQLLKFTEKHRISLAKVVDEFHNYRSVSVEEKYRRSFTGSKWQDLYVRLHLTSHKMQHAYNKLTSIMEDIENHLDRGTNESELLEALQIKLDDVYRDAVKARDLAELSTLIVVRMNQKNYNQEKGNDIMCDVSSGTLRSDVPIVKDTDPEIMDEVFEEYIRENYSDALVNCNMDDYLEKCSKLDKMLSSNLMSELKEALIEKQKDTRERELRAMERMGYKIPNESPTANDSKQDHSSDSDNEMASRSSIPYSKETLEEKEKLISKSETIAPLPPPPPPPPPDLMKPKFHQPRVEIKPDGAENENEKSRCFIPLVPFRPILLPSFLSNEEETFIGSGENSDEDISTNESEEKSVNTDL
ncbi:uncharacterized protein LOC107226824 isoform X1 [Neodiprion lecontei]|uniref:Uncharacterized protein LOC107226824 isoform X1 n=1 Tax=Neodiprion lecontei TaxID=441921 RepID=A0A6J0C7C6_NEOLC|nr:uncharacterized protein LOC107226824 isoform X1 [Neodiprion lecontei]